MEIAIARPRSRPSSPARSATKGAVDIANDALFAEARGKDFTTPLWHWALPARESRFVAVPMRGAVDLATHAALAWPITLTQGFSFAKQWTWQTMRPAHELVQKKRWRVAFPRDMPRPKDWLTLATGFAEPFGLRMHVSAGNDLSFCLLLTKGDEPLAYAAREVKLAAKHVEHNFLVTAPNKRGAGIGARILHNALGFYALLEIKTIGLTAGLSAGGAVWAKFGFRPVAEAEWKVVKRKVRDNLRRAPAGVLKAFKEKNGLTLKDAVRDIFGEKDDEGPRAIWDIVDLDHGPLSLPSMRGLDHGLAALLLRGTRWKGILDLEDEEAVDRVNAYLATKLAPRGQTPQTP